jgi:putative addiction module killer protein
MIKIHKTEIFDNWMRKLKDRTGRAIINARILRLSHGNYGDTKYLGDGINELRIDFGPGYRVYYTQIRQAIVILLCGGDKSTQSSDLKKAKSLAENLEVQL